jgi:hypothetical protein
MSGDHQQAACQPSIASMTCKLGLFQTIGGRYDPHDDFEDRIPCRSTFHGPCLCASVAPSETGGIPAFERSQDDAMQLSRRGRGADDGAGHVRRCRGCDDGPNHTSSSRMTDSASKPHGRAAALMMAAGHVRHGRGTDDAPNHG